MTASTERPRGTPQQVRATLEARLGEALADVKLAGLTRDDARAIADDLLARLWASEAPDEASPRETQINPTQINPTQDYAREGDVT